MKMKGIVSEVVVVCTGLWWTRVVVSELKGCAGNAPRMSEFLGDALRR